MSWKLRLFYLSVIAFLSVGLANDAWAQETTPAEKKPAAKDSANEEKADPQADENDHSEMTFDEIVEEYNERTRAFRAHRRSLPLAEKRKDPTPVPSGNDYKDRIIEIINEEPGSQVGLDAIDWWIRQGGRSKHMRFILRLVMKNYSELESIHKYVPYFAFYLHEIEAEENLRLLMENSPSNVIKGTASFELHELLNKRLEKLEGEKAELVKAEIKTLRDSIYDEYADVADALGSKLVTKLESIEFVKKLAVGNPVPDIVGTDIAGVDFKLSDYDGKVRVLSFWGHW